MKAYAETPDADVKVQLALKAYRDNRVTTLDKIRSLFLHMWRSVRGVRAFSSRILLSQFISIISHFHVSMTSQEYHPHIHSYSQESHSKINARMQTQL